MCLNVLNREPKVMKTEQVFYKIVRDCGMEWYRTPYKNFPVSVGKDYQIPEEDGWGIYFNPFRSTYGVEFGGFHLYERLKDAKSDMVILGKEKHKILRAVVPAGTEYYKGLFGDYVCVAVKKVRYEEL